MVRLTIICRQYDALFLAEGIESDKSPELDQYKQQAKQLLKRMANSPNIPRKMSIESGAYIFHYVIYNQVCYLTLTEKGYPKKLAFEYLDELSNEFQRLYGPQITIVQRPYAFIKFDSFISKTKKLYMDSRTQRNLSKLNQEVAEVQQIMTRNIQDVLAQGEKLDNMAKMSSTLSEESKKYSKKATSLYNKAIIRKYLPVAVLILVVILILYVRRLYK